MTETTETVDPVFKALGNPDPDICKVCGERIIVQIFRGTGACCTAHDKIMRGEQPDGRIKTTVGMLKRHIGKQVEVFNEGSPHTVEGILRGVRDNTGSAAIRELLIQPKGDDLIEGQWVISCTVLVGTKKGALSP